MTQPVFEVGDIVYEWSAKTPAKVIAVKRDPKCSPHFDKIKIRWADGSVDTFEGRDLHSYADKIIEAEHRIEAYKAMIKVGEGIMP